jgi:hypothetical protein
MASPESRSVPLHLHIMIGIFTGIAHQYASIPSIPMTLNQISYCTFESALFVLTCHILRIKSV